MELLLFKKTQQPQANFANGYIFGKTMFSFKTLFLVLCSFFLICNSTYSQTQIYFTDYTNPPVSPATQSSATVTYSTTALTGWTNYSSTTYPAYAQTTGSAGYVQLNFASALTLTSNGTDRGKIIVSWGATNNRPLNITLNGGTPAQIDAVTTSAQRNAVRSVTYDIPNATTSISSIRLSSSGGGGVFLFNIEVKTYSTKPEPTNHPTNFANGTITTSNIPLTWTAAVTGTQAPDGYLIKASTGTVTDPVDGTDPSDDINLSDGNAVVHVSGQSSNAYSSFTGFTAGTQYNFKIYSYTNSGASVNFKTASAPSLTAFTLSTPPTLSATANQTVDNNFNISFGDDASWRGVVTGITVDGTNYAAASGVYSLSAGSLVLTTSAIAQLQTAGSHTVVVTATGYANASVTQTNIAGAATKLSMQTQPAAPATNGAVLATQPVVRLLDQYNNLTTSTANVTASVGAGSWSIGGTNPVSASSGTATFTDLTATSTTAVIGATISFAASGVATGVTSGSFNIPAPPGLTPPVLTAASGATVAADFAITFTDNASWRSKITSVLIGADALPANAYDVSNAGQLILKPSQSAFLQTAGSFTITIVATDYDNATVSQLILAASPTAESSISFGTVSSSGIPVNITTATGKGSRRIIVVRADNAVNWSPTDGVAVSGVNAAFGTATDQGNGNKVVYDGTAEGNNVVTVTGLTGGTQYYFAVYEYNGTGATSNYLTGSPGTANIFTSPILTLSSGSNTQSVRINNAINNIVYSVTGAVSTNCTGLPAGLTYNTGTNTISGTPTELGTFNFTVTATNAGGSSTATGTITVYKKKIAFLYTSTDATAVAGSNKLYGILNADPKYNITLITASNTAGDTAAIMANCKNNFDLTILHEAINSGNLTAQRLGTYIGEMPLLNTKAHMYGKTNWPAGAGQNGTPGTDLSVNIFTGQTSHPIFSGVTISGNNAVLAGNSGIMRWVNGSVPLTNLRLLAKDHSNTATNYSILEDSIQLTGKKKYMLVALSAASEDITANGAVLMKNAVDHLMATSIFASAGPNGSISSPGESDVDQGESKTYTITPNSGYEIEDVKVNGISVGAVSSYAFSNVSGNYHTIAATFKVAAYTWNGNAGDNDYSNGANWQAGTAPSPATAVNVTVADGKVLPLSATTSFNNLVIGTGSAVNLNGQTLTINGAVTGTGTLTGSSTSNLIIGGTAGTLSFTSGGRVLRNLTLNTGASAALGTALDITGGSAEGVVTVASGATLNTGGNLTLKSDDNGTARLGQIAGTISGNATVERFIGIPTAKRAWRMLTVPLRSTASDVSIFDSWQEGGAQVTGYGTLVTGASADPSNNGLDLTSGASIRSFVNGAWADVTNTKTTALFTNAASAANKAFAVFVRGDRSNLASTSGTSTTVLRATGALQTGDQQFDISSTASAYTLVGNPYASPVDFHLFKIENFGNINPSFWFWDPNMMGNGGAYVSVASDDPNNASSSSYTVSNLNSSGTRHIPSGMAFFVQTKSGAAANTVAFKEAHKSPTTVNNVFRTGSQIEKLHANLLVLGTSNTWNSVDGFVGRYSNNYSTAVIVNEDISKMLNTEENFSIKRNGSLLSIESRPLIDGDDTLFVSMSNIKQNRSYKFAFDPQNFDAPGLTAYLEDAFVNNATPVSLSAPTEVVFTTTTVAGSFAADRFRIVFKQSSTLSSGGLTVKASLTEKQVRIDWSMVNENNVKGYTVERSADGKTFTALAAVNAKGNDNSTVSYDATDANPLNGMNYYRIKATDVNGKITYSAIVRIKTNDTKATVTVYPNPVKGEQLNIQLNGLTKGTYSVRLYNNLGQEVYGSTLQVTQAAMSQALNIAALKVTGVYTLRITNGEQTIEQIIVSQ